MRKNIVFVILEFLNKSIPFFLISYYTAVLSVDDFYHIEQINMIISIVTMLVMFSGNTYYQINYYNERSSEYKASSVLMSLCNASILFVIFIILYNMEVINNILYLMIPLYALSFSYVTLKLISYQMSSSVYRYSALQILSTILNVVISVFFLEFIITNWQGRILGVLLPPILIAIFFLKDLFLLIKTKVDLKKVYILGLSLLPHNILSGWLRDNIARMAFIKYNETILLGYWGVTFNMAVIFNIVINALNLVITPKVIKCFSCKKENIKFLIAISVFYIVLGFIFSILIPYLFYFMIDSKFYYDDLKYVISILALAFSLNGICVQLSNILNVMGLSKYVSVATIVSIMTYIILIINNVDMKNIVNSYFFSYLVQFLVLSGIYVCKRRSFFIAIH